MDYLQQKEAGFHAAPGFANLHCPFYRWQHPVCGADPAWPHASTYQGLLKLPPVIDVIHLVGPREAQVVIIVHAGDAEAVLLFRRGALDELGKRKRVRVTWPSKQSKAPHGSCCHHP